MIAQALFALVAHVAVVAPARAADVPLPASIRPLLGAHCIDCHEGARSKAGLDLAAVLAADSIDEGVLRALRQRFARRDMPPATELERPGDAEYRDAGKAIAVITEPATVAPAIGSAVVVPATPAGAAAATSEVVVPAAAAWMAKAPVAREAYAEMPVVPFVSPTFAKAGVDPTSEVVVAAVAWRSTFGMPSPAWIARIETLVLAAGSWSSITRTRCAGVEPVRAYPRWRRV